MAHSVTFIVPTYNAAPYLGQCLDSILALQMQGWEREIIVVDDGSTDCTAEILAGYKEKYGIVFLSQENRGQGAARNRAISVASGDYLCLVDADDALVPNAVLPFQLMSSGMDLISIDIIRVTLDGNRYPYRSRTRGNIMGAACAYIYRREFVREKNITFPEGIFHEDEEFCTKAWALAESFRRYSAPFYLYYERQESTCTTTNSEKAKKKMMDMCQVMIHLLQFACQDESIRSRIQTKIDFLTLDILIKMKRGNFEPAFREKIIQELTTLGLLPLSWRWNLHYNFIRLKLGR